MKNENRGTRTKDRIRRGGEDKNGKGKSKISGVNWKEP